VRLWCVVLALVACSACVEGTLTPKSRLTVSFAQQIAGVDGVKQFERVESEIMFARPNTDGDVVRWRVVIDSVTVHPSNPDTEPERGDVVSSWYADGVLVEPVGSMSRLPEAFLEAGVAQECYALWDSDRKTWGW